LLTGWGRGTHPGHVFLSLRLLSAWPQEGREKGGWVCASWWLCSSALHPPLRGPELYCEMCVPLACPGQHRATSERKMKITQSRCFQGTKVSRCLGLQADWEFWPLISPEDYPFSFCWTRNPITVSKMFAEPHLESRWGHHERWGYRDQHPRAAGVFQVKGPSSLSFFYFCL
jgi:hypothetical protein